jgi:hypothetical protein
MRGRRSASAAAVLAVVVVSGVTACASPHHREGGCVPRMSAEPRSVHVGDTVTFSTDDVCKVDVPDGGWRVEARLAGAVGTRATARSAEPFDGSWSVRILVPAAFPVGDASIGITNWDYSSCPDTASCAGPFADVTVER